MVGKADRGTKLKCQNEEWPIPFYDLNAAQPSCSAFGTAFDHEAAKELEPPSTNYRRARQAPAFEIVAPEAASQSATVEVDDLGEADDTVKGTISD